MTPDNLIILVAPFFKHYWLLGTCPLPLSRRIHYGKNPLFVCCLFPGSVLFYGFIAAHEEQCPFGLIGPGTILQVPQELPAAGGVKC